MFRENLFKRNIVFSKQLYNEYSNSLTVHLKALDILGRFFRRPLFLYLEIIIVLLWSSLSFLNKFYHLGWGIPYFSWREQGISWASLIISTGVLVRDDIASKLVDQQFNVMMQLHLTTEQKTSKIIALLEELRCDLPHIANRFDVEAEYLKKAVDIDELIMQAKDLTPHTAVTVKPLGEPIMSQTNGIMMQYFHWYNAPDGTLWQQVSKEADALAKKGVTALWLPPACKGHGGGYDVGYGLYDLFDLG
jgi:uncharacterized membrane protein